jgi:hypothetical protein
VSKSSKVNRYVGERRTSTKTTSNREPSTEDAFVVTANAMAVPQERIQMSKLKIHDMIPLIMVNKLTLTVSNINNAIDRSCCVFVVDRRGGLVDPNDIRLGYRRFCTIDDSESRSQIPLRGLAVERCELPVPGAFRYQVGPLLTGSLVTSCTYEWLSSNQIIRLLRLHSRLVGKEKTKQILFDHRRPWDPSDLMVCHTH